MNYPSTSLAAVFHAPTETFELREIQIPELKPGTILVEVLMCTICGSDLHTHSGRRSSPTPTILGHETVGRLVWPALVIDGAGNQVRAGERLIWSLAAFCGRCLYCSTGLPQKCIRLVKYGHHAITPDWPLSGGLAQHCMLVPGTFFLGVPESVPDALAAPATCATATCAAAIAAAGEIEGKSVLILGAGMLGNTACAMLDTAGARNIMVADAVATRAQGAKKFGARSVLDATFDLPDFLDAVKECNGGFGADIVFELAGANPAVQRALRATQTGGQCILVGSVFPQEPLPVDMEDIVRRMIQIRGVYNYAPENLIRALEFITLDAWRYPLEALVQGSFTLPDVQAAFAAASAPTAPLRVAVCPNLSRAPNMEAE